MSWKYTSKQFLTFKSDSLVNYRDILNVTLLISEENISIN